MILWKEKATTYYYNEVLYSSEHYLTSEQLLFNIIHGFKEKGDFTIEVLDYDNSYSAKKYRTVYTIEDEITEKIYTKLHVTE